MTNTPILPAIHSPIKLFLRGPFGSGKTTLAIERIRWLLRQERIRGDDLLVLLPQRTLARPYTAALHSAELPPGPSPRITTVAGLARSAVELYWPLLATEADFAEGGREPTFLSLETAQYHMATLVDAAIERGEFDGIRIDRSRIITQVLDNLNKAALHSFTLEEAYARLELAVPGGEGRTARLNALRAAERISADFRALCLRHTLIDFSLQIELFNRQVLVNPWSRTHLFRMHRHLIFDNVEEDSATAHRLVREWLPHLDSALLIADEDGGFRVFLGADPEGAGELAAACGDRLRLDGSLVMADGLRLLAAQVDRAVRGPQAAGPLPTAAEESEVSARFVVPQEEFRFYPQMIDWTVREIRRLVEEEGVAPAEIALLAPFVSDALRFSLQTGLERAGIHLTTHRPSRALEDEPAARTLITLAALAHPHWGIRPAPADVTQALTASLAVLDPVRGHLLSRLVYPPARSGTELGRFGALAPEVQARITYAAGEAYDRLRAWLAAYGAEAELTPLDQFFARLFGELLSQPGYGFHANFDAARVANQLVESARSFRWALENTASASGDPRRLGLELGREYVRLFEGGALAALYVPGWREADDAVFLAPAYTFLMRNRAVDIQFWLDIGASGWWERLYQPLTHPYVLSGRWGEHEIWNDYHEYTTRQESLRRLLLGLVRRTRRRVYLGMSDYSESGFEQRGPLLSLVNRLLIEATSTGAD